MASTDEQQVVWSVGRLLEWTAKWFAERGVEGGRLAAELLLARAMGCTKIALYTRYDQEPTAEQRAAFKELVCRAGEHVPVAYLLGVREFYSLDFIVTPAVLVPRPETETIVQRTIEMCRAEPSRRWHILDVGTGSGNIAVAIAKYCEHAFVVATDVSTEALAVAAGNVEKHGVGARVRLVEADGPALPGDARPEGGFDLLVSNPPYISDAVWNDLPPNVRNHEPRLALTGRGGDGLEMYRRFAAEGADLLKPGGRLLTEIAQGQRDAVVAIFKTNGCWQYLGSHRDGSDPHERVLEFAVG